MEKTHQKRKYKQKRRWGTAEEQILVAVWAERVHDLRGQKRTAHIYAEMAKAMENRDCSFTPEEVRVKVHNLTNRYRLEKKQIESCGRSLPAWPLYAAVDSIIVQGQSQEMQNLLASTEVFEIESSLDSNSETPTLSPLRNSTPNNVANGLLTSNSDSSMEEPEKKMKVHKNFQRTILKEFMKTNKKFYAEIKRAKKVDEQIINLQTRQTDILEKFVEKNNDFQNRLLQILSSNKNT